MQIRCVCGAHYNVAPQRIAGKYLYSSEIDFCRGCEAILSPTLCWAGACRNIGAMLHEEYVAEDGEYFYCEIHDPHQIPGGCLLT